MKTEAPSSTTTTNLYLPETGAFKIPSHLTEKFSWLISDLGGSPAQSKLISGSKYSLGEPIKSSLS